MQRDAMDLYTSLANREAVLGDLSNGERLAAALPELSEEDRDDMCVSHLSYFAKNDLLMTFAAASPLIKSLIVGIELGREMERWATSQIAKETAS